MPIFQLSDELVFPSPNLANEDGILAIGGDLKIDRLLLAYSNGIFPWPVEGFPLLWWSPDPRLLLFPERFKASKSLRQVIRRKKFELRLDTCFAEVIEACAKVTRKGEQGTWITSELMQAYIALHEQGFAHSVEVFFEGSLVGGLYGVSLGGMFCGESMFHQMSDASKVALYYLSELLKRWDFDFIDAQVPTDHLLSLGAEVVSRSVFLEQLGASLLKPGRRGDWQQYMEE